MGIESPLHLLFIAAVALIALGPRRLPEIARSLGRALREFREAMDEGQAPPDGPQVDPPARVGSGDAPDRRPL